MSAIGGFGPTVLVLEGYYALYRVSFKAYGCDVLLPLSGFVLSARRIPWSFLPE